MNISIRIRKNTPKPLTEEQILNRMSLQTKIGIILVILSAVLFGLALVVTDGWPFIFAGLACTIAFGLDIGFMQNGAKALKELQKSK